MRSWKIGEQSDLILLLTPGSPFFPLLEIKPGYIKFLFLYKLYSNSIRSITRLIQFKPVRTRITYIDRSYTLFFFSLARVNRLIRIKFLYGVSASLITALKLLRASILLPLASSFPCF